MRLYGIRTCDTCRKALKALADAGKTVEFVDIRSDPPDAATRARFAAAFGAALVNRRSTMWRALDPAARETAPEELIARHPTVMKRPVIDGPDGLTLGWDASVRAQLLG